MSLTLAGERPFLQTLLVLGNLSKRVLVGRHKPSGMVGSENQTWDLIYDLLKPPNSERLVEMYLKFHFGVLLRVKESSHQNKMSNFLQ